MAETFAYIQTLLTAQSLEQIIVFAVLGAAIVAFMWGKFRYDLVALLTLLTVVAAGILPADQALVGFTHPAVVIVVSMFVLSQALVDSGIVEYVTGRLSGLAGRPVVQLVVLTAFVAVMSGFLANVGALAFAIPIAVKMAKESDVSPSMFLMPVAFASHLGAFLTLFGSASNLIVSGFREDAVGAGFQVFSFAPLGVVLILIGVLFLALVGWRFIPRRESEQSGLDLFSVSNYLTEMKVPDGSQAAGSRLKELPLPDDNDIDFIAVIRGEARFDNPSLKFVLEPGDVILLQDDAETLSEMKDENGLELVGRRAREAQLENDDETVDMESVITQDSPLVDHSWKEVPLAVHYGVNLLAASRSGGQLDKHLDDLEFQAGDVLLLRGRKESIRHTIQELGCLPLESRDLTFGRPRKILATLGLFMLAVGTASLGFLPVHIIFLAAAVLAVVSGLVGIKRAYENINWSVIVLLGAIISFGEALVVSGAADQLAAGITGLSAYLSPTLMVVAVLVVTTLLSDFVNANVSAVVMAPVAITVAQTLGVSVDPFLMTVIVGANMAFLTPTAHESNTLVMGVGGYKYRDFWRLGLPMEIIIAVISLPLILSIWPLEPTDTGQQSTRVQTNQQLVHTEKMDLLTNTQ